MAIIDGMPATSFDKADREWIKNVASEMGGGGSSGLPEVTTSDNGKVLGVSNGEWGAVSKGWNVGTTQLFSETLTTVASEGGGNNATMAYTGDPTTISAMTIVFNGTTYNCEQQSENGQYWWGAPSPNDFSEYPFVVLASGGNWYLITETVGTYTVTGSVESVETTENFRSAVNSIVNTNGMLVTITEDDNYNLNTDKTFSEIYTAITNGVVPFAKYNRSYYCLDYAYSAAISFSAVYIESNTVYKDNITIESNNNVEITASQYPSND